MKMFQTTFMLNRIFFTSGNSLDSLFPDMVHDSLLNDLDHMICQIAEVCVQPL